MTRKAQFVDKFGYVFGETQLPEPIQESLWSPLYDSVRIDYGLMRSPQITLFNIPYGQSGKTRRETNMPYGGSVPNPFIVTAIRAGISAPDARTFPFSLLSDLTLTLRVGARRYAGPAPLFMFPMLYPMPYSIDHPQWMISKRTLRKISKGLLHEITPIHINRHQNFGVEIEQANIGREAQGLLEIPTDIELMVVLGGFELREV